MKLAQKYGAIKVTPECIERDLNILSRQLDEQEISTEGLQSWMTSMLLTLADIAASIGLINKTNVLSVLNGFSRSELRQYSDDHAATMSRVEQAKIVDLVNIKIAIPNGMKVTYLEAVSELIDIYKLLDIKFNTDLMVKSVDNVLVALRSAESSDEFEKNSQIKKHSSTFAQLMKDIDKLSSMQDKVFVEDQHDEMNADFKKGYKSVSDIKKSRDGLLGLEDEYMNLINVSTVPGKLSAKFTEIQKLMSLTGYTLPKDVASDILDMTKTCAKFFEALGGVLNMQMKLDHNMVLNYVSFAAALDK